MKQSTLGCVAGCFLGFGAPLGSLFLEFLFLCGRFHPELVKAQLSEHLYYYAYMAVLTPLAFGFFGWFLGNVGDKIQTQKKHLESMMSVLEVKSMTDDVTGVYNHRHLLEEIDRELERSHRHKHFLSGMMVDIDSFKNINDSYGHLTGDYVLREMAYVLNESIRKIDVIGRYGGDEFAIILPEAELPTAQIVSDRILANVRKHRFKTQKDYVPLTVSIGLFSFEDSKNLNKTQFIEKMDQAMFEAKKQGKNRAFTVPQSS